MSIPYFCMGDEPLSPIGGMHTRSEMDAVDWPSYCLSGAEDWDTVKPHEGMGYGWISFLFVYASQMLCFWSLELSSWFSR